MGIERGEDLPERILKRGWSDGRRKEFTRQYGSLIRRSILYHIRRCFGGAQLQVLSEQLRGLQEGHRPDTKEGIRWKILDIATDTWQDVLTEAFKSQGNLIERWFEYKENQKERKKEPRDFETYLKGAVQIKFQSHLRRHKGLEEATVHLEEAQEWLGEKGKLSDEGISIPVEDEISCYWDGLIRCRLPSPNAIERELVQIRREASTVLVWACALLKEQLRKRQQAKKLENLQAFMAFYCSQTGPKREGPPVCALLPRRLSLEQVAGRYFRWEEDICRGIFRKRIRKDRIMEQIREIILTSPYRDMVG